LASPCCSIGLLSDPAYLEPAQQPTWQSSKGQEQNMAITIMKRTTNKQPAWQSPK
jgi:hypothetical protein